MFLIVGTFDYCSKYFLKIFTMHYNIYNMLRSHIVYCISSNINGMQISFKPCFVSFQFYKFMYKNKSKKKNRKIKRATICKIKGRRRDWLLCGRQRGNSKDQSLKFLQYERRIYLSKRQQAESKCVC